MIQKLFKIKKLIVVALIFCLPINCFADIISSNDGSSFITKSEYDSIVSSFQKDISERYMNIDTTISEAIASYFAQVSYRKDVNRNILYLEHCTQPSIWCRTYKDMEYKYTDALWRIQFFMAGNLWTSSRVYSKMINIEINVASESLASRMYVNSFSDGAGNKKYRFAGFTTDLAVSRDLIWSRNLLNSQERSDSPYAGTVQPWYVETPNFNIGHYKEVKSIDNYQFGMAVHPNAGTQFNDFGRINSLYYYTKNYTEDFLFDSNTTEESNIYFFDEKTQGVAYTQDGFSNRLQSEWWNGPRCTFSRTGAMLITGTTRLENSTPKRNSSDTSTYILEDAPIDKRLWFDICNSDHTNYNYYDESGIRRSMNAYPISGGIPVVTLKKGDRFTWEPYFEDAGNHNMYFFWGPNTDSPNESNTINVKIDGTTTTWEPEIGQTAKISFEADRNGIVFVKWRSTDATIDAAINVAKSKPCVVNEITWLR